MTGLTAGPALQEVCVVTHLVFNQHQRPNIIRHKQCVFILIEVKST